MEIMAQRLKIIYIWKNSALKSSAVKVYKWWVVCTNSAALESLTIHMIADFKLIVKSNFKRKLNLYEKSSFNGYFNLSLRMWF